MKKKVGIIVAIICAFGIGIHGLIGGIKNQELFGYMVAFGGFAVVILGSIGLWIMNHPETEQKNNTDK